MQGLREGSEAGPGLGFEFTVAHKWPHMVGYTRQLCRALRV